MNEHKSRISIIAALGKRTRAIGSDNKLLWDLPGDLQRFSKLTSGHPVIMGRHTWLSLPEKYRPLPNRTNIILSGAAWFEPPGTPVARTLDQAIGLAQEAPGSEEIFIIGGGRVYADALSLADRLYITEVDDDAEGDTFFPEYRNEFTREIEREEHLEHLPSYTFITLKR